MQRILFACFAAVFALAAAGVCAPPPRAAQEIRNEFFIVSEVNLQKPQLILEKPTQINLLMAVNAKTVFTNEQGHRLPLDKIRTGDTVFVTYVRRAKRAVALSIHSGPMTVALLHRLYVKG